MSATYCAQAFSLQASPEFKGIKTVLRGLSRRCSGSKPALNSKGLRRTAHRCVDQLHGSKPALNSKGLRRIGEVSPSICLVLQASPEFKGIKTKSNLINSSAGCSKPALNSKGLRR